MIRHVATTVELAAAAAATAYVLIASLQTPGTPAVRPGTLAAAVAVGFGAFVMGLALYVAADLWAAPRLARWRRRRTRRPTRHRARRFGGWR